MMAEALPPSSLRQMRLLSRLQMCLLVALALLPFSHGQVEETCSAQGEGFQCVDQETANQGNLNCIQSVSADSDSKLSILPPLKHCSGALGSGQTSCCREPVPERCPDKGCAEKYHSVWGPDFQCTPKDLVQTWPKVCVDGGDLCGQLSTSGQCGCCAPKYKECEDVGCSRKKGYQCKNATEAKEWPQLCTQSDRLCKKNCFIPNTGSTPYSPLNVDPSSPSPEDCQMKCQAHPLCQWFNYVPASSSPSGCWLLTYAKTGENSALHTIGWVSGPKHCDKCYCCPPVETPPDPCEDTGCKEEFGGMGKCQNVEKANWDELDANFDLAAGSRDNNTCKKKDEKEQSCCRCLKKKSCLDVGCKEEFGGHGICVDQSKADVALLKKTIDFPAGEIKGKCRNSYQEDCCSCFKKITPTCKNKECESLKGKCVIKGEIPPPNHSKSFPCNKSLDCNCWLPITPPCHDDKCTKDYKGKCVGPDQEKPAGYFPSNYWCDGKRDCPCYVNRCHDEKCTDEKNGKCIGPGTEPPMGWIRSGYNCKENKECPCYVEDKGCEDEKCTKEYNGKCINLPSKPPVGWVPTGFNCKGNQECPCYTTCREEKCEKSGGRCFIKTDQFKPPSGYKESNNWCNEKINCKCFTPNCPTTTSCRKAGGSCFSSKPAGGVLQKKGKCKGKCACYKVLTIQPIRPPSNV